MIRAASIGVSWWSGGLAQAIQGKSAVILTTPHSLHAGHVIAAVHAGKHVFSR
jgi:predicted dehydrogenase